MRNRLPPWIAAALLIMLRAGIADAGTTRYVNALDATCGGQSPCYTTIQAAVTAAQAADTVQIQAGTYTEQVLVSDKNSAGAPTEASRIIIRADPAAPVGSVILHGSVSQCTGGYAVKLQRSRFITVRGLVITGAGGQGISLLGGSSQNQAISIERNRIFGNGSSACNGGITIAGGNPGTLILNNVLYGNGRNAIAITDADGGPHHIIGNTIHGNGYSGVSVGRNQQVLLVNNSITGNGTASGSTGGRFGVSRAAVSNPNPAGIQLLSNVICGNRLGEIDGPTLDNTDSGNLTPTGTEGPGVSASTGCNNPATLYANVDGPDQFANTADDTFTLAPTSPLIDHGVDPRTLGLATALNPLVEADLLADGARPRAGTQGGTPYFDVGAIEFEPPDTQVPAITFLQPAANAFVRGIVSVSAQAIDDTAVASFTVRADSQALSLILTPTPPAASVTATAAWNTSTFADGTHTLTAQGADPSGNSTSVQRVVIVDNTSPDTQITAGPSGTITSSSATFTFTGMDNVSAAGNLVYAWRLDEGPYSAFSPATTAALTGLADATHTFEVTARDQAGNEDPTPAQRSFTVSSINVTITDPTTGATVPAGALVVRGTVQAGGQTVGVSVNGAPANIDGTSFSAVVPVDSTTIALTAVATTVTGATASTSVSITVSPSGQAFELVATPSSGIPPLSVSFSLRGGPVPATIQLDFDGNGTVDFTGSTLQGQPFTFTQPGLYIPRSTIVDSTGAQYTATTAVNVLARDQVDGLLKGIWNAMKARLIATDIEGALTYFVPLQQDRFRTLFTALGAQILQIAQDMQDIQPVYVVENEAQYRLRRTQLYGGQLVTLTYYVYFLQDDTGLWRIAGF